MSDEARARIVRKLRRQGASCAALGSPLYAGLLARAADDVVSGGVVGAALAGRDMDPPGSALALRLMGAVHRLVLTDRAPALAAFYPSAGGRRGSSDAEFEAFTAVLEERAEEIRGLLDEPVQTNEVGRCAALVGGFLLVANKFGLPLRVLEIGASGGLNLRWDHYRYEARGETWGPAGSPVRLCDFDTPPTPPFEIDAVVVTRRGCDPRPLDFTDERDRTTLLAYVWPDQVHRIRLLRAALDVAARVPAEVDAASADVWLGEQLAEPVRGCATVVFHSIVEQYLPGDVRAAVDETIATAGRSATAAAPVARLAMEPGGDEANVTLQLWPGEGPKLIARAGYHGRPTRWRA